MTMFLVGDENLSRAEFKGILYNIFRRLLKM